MNTMQSRAGSEIVVTTMRLPRELITEVKIQAIRAGRSFNAHLVEILKEAAGGDLAGQTPAAVKAQQDHSEASSHAAG